MYIAMNRFQVVKDRARDFEELWQQRDSQLPDTPGFVEFHLLRGPEHEDHILYSSHTVWETTAHFESWTKSEAFRKAHSKAGATSDGLTLGHPVFEGFEVVQRI